MTPATRTEALIRDLAARPLPRPLSPLTLAGAMLAGMALGLGAFLAVFGLRPDLTVAMQGLPVQAKSALPLAILALALWRAVASARPGATVRLWPLALPAAAAAALVAHRLATMGPAPVWAEIRGQTALACLVSLSALSALPLAAGLRLMRRGAPTRPGLSGGLLGLAAGAGVAAGYALHCTEDSPLFFVVWYGLGILVPTLAGAWLGRRLLAW